MDRCFVTGRGVLCACGLGVAALTGALRRGQSGVRRSERLRAAGVDVCVAAEIPDLEFADAVRACAAGLPEPLALRAQKGARRSPRPAQAAVLAALEAWREAGLSRGGPRPERIAVVVAGHNVNQRYQSERWRELQTESAYLPPTYALHFMDTDLVGTLSEVFAIRGEGFTVGGASASGNVGLIQARRLLRSGAAEVCLVVGAMADLGPLEIRAFRQLGALAGDRFKDAPERACRPFDRGHEGFVYGQASACLVLESEASVRARGVEPLAELAGGAVVLDGSRLPAPDPRGEARAMQRAMEDAGVTPADVGYVSTHGTASPAGDASEAAALREAFGGALGRVRLNATKSITGHCLWSAGVVEALATVIQLCEGFLHPTLNLEDPTDPDLPFVGAHSEPAGISVALSNAFGFGGINTAIVVKKGMIP